MDKARGVQQASEPADRVQLLPLTVQQSSAQPFAWSSPAGDVLARKKDSFPISIDPIPLYTAPPSLSAAVALAVEKCAKVCDELANKKGTDDEADNEALVCAGTIRALAKTITAEAEQMRKDRARLDGEWAITQMRDNEILPREQPKTIIDEAVSSYCHALRAVTGHTGEDSEFCWCARCGLLLKDSDPCELDLSRNNS